MTREEVKEMLPIIKAFAEGKTIQYKYITGWENIKFPAFNGNPSDYRIKPESMLKEILKRRKTNGLLEGS